jgi:hypothetical protein
MAVARAALLASVGDALNLTVNQTMQAYNKINRAIGPSLALAGTVAHRRQR